MKKQSGLAKSVIGLVVTILIVVGGLYGLNIDIELADSVQPPENETESLVSPAPEAENADTSVVVDVETTVEVPDAVETEQPSNESAPLEDETQSVDESVEEDVTPPADDTENVVTEGE